MNDNKNISLLYVDDEPANLFLFKASFERKYTVYTADSGQTGLEILSQKPNEIIVVISDMRMPMMNGIEFIKRAKEIHSKIYYYILTGFEFNEEIENALNEGLIQQFFTKPFDIHSIESAIKKVA